MFSTSRVVITLSRYIAIFGLYLSISYTLNSEK